MLNSTEHEIYTPHNIKMRSNRYETYKTGFSKGLGPFPWGGLRGGTEAKIKPFRGTVMLHIKLKPMLHAATR